MAKPRNPAGAGGRGGSGSGDKESKANMKAIQTNSAQIKSLAEAIENLTKVVAANAGTMKDLSTKEQALAKAIGEMKEDSFVETVIKRTVSNAKQDDRILGYALQGLVGIGKMGLKGAKAGISGMIDSAKKRKEEKAAAAAAKKPSDFEKAKKKGLSDKQILAGFGGRAAKNQMLKKAPGVSPVAAPPAAAAAAGPTGATPMTPAGATPAEGGGAGGLGMGIGANIGGLLGGLAGGLTGGLIQGIGMGISKIPPAFVTGMGYLTAGLGIFALGMAGIAKIITLFGGEEALKDVLAGLGEGFATFSEVDGVNLLAVAAALIPFAAGFTALALAMTSDEILKFFGGGIDFSVLTQMAESLIPFGEIDAQNLSNIGKGVADINSAVSGIAGQGFFDILANFFTGKDQSPLFYLARGLKELQSVGGEKLGILAENLMPFNNIDGENLAGVGQGLVDISLGLGGLTAGGLFEKVASFFTGGTDDTLTNLAKSLMSFQEINGKNLKDTGDGLVVIADAFKALTYGNLLGSIGAWFTGNTNDDILTKLAISLTKFKDVDGANLLNVGNGLKGLADGLTTLGGANVSGAAGASNAARNIGQGGGAQTAPGSRAPVEKDAGGKGGGRPPIEAASGIGALSARYESEGDVGTISSGARDPGGKSYGTYQLSSKTGTMQEFLNSPEGQAFAQKYGLDPSQIGTAAFDAAYKNAVAGDKEGFAGAQEAFIKRTKYDPVARAAQEMGYDISDPTIQKALFSQSVQHGLAGNKKILAAAMQQAGPNASTQDVLTSLYTARNQYVGGLSSLDAGMKASISKRMENELGDALHLASMETANQPPVVAVVAPQTAGGGGGGGGGGGSPTQPMIPPGSGPRGNLDKNIAFNSYADGLSMA